MVVFKFTISCFCWLDRRLCKPLLVIILLSVQSQRKKLFLKENLIPQTRLLSKPRLSYRLKAFFQGRKIVPIVFVSCFVNSFCLTKLSRVKEKKKRGETFFVWRKSMPTRIREVVKISVS